MKEEDRLDLSKVDWYHVLPRLGIDDKLIARPNRRGPCPICGGSTRFRFTNKAGLGTWICNCGSGDGIRLIAEILNMTDAQAIWEVRKLVYGCEGHVQNYIRTSPPPVVPKRTAEDMGKAQAMNDRILSECVPIDSSVAHRYLVERVHGLEAEWVNTDTFRFHPSLYHYDEETDTKSLRPAMIACVRDPSAGKAQDVVALHRTYLEPSGGKAKVSRNQVKKVTPPSVEKLAGQSIKLNTAEGEVAIVTEGIESGFAWVIAHANRFPVYSALNCYNMANFIWPAGLKVLVIAGDHDPSNPKTGLRPGFHNAMLLKQRAIGAGLIAIVKIPKVQGIDWDDLLNEGLIEQFNLTQRQVTA